MQQISFNTLPEAVQSILEQVQILSQKFDKIRAVTFEQQDEDRYVDINEIRQLVFPQWAKQTLYNKCCQGLVPHSRIGSRLLFHIKECREWRDEQIQRGKIKGLSQLENEAKELYQQHKQSQELG